MKMPNKIWIFIEKRIAQATLTKEINRNAEKNDVVVHA